MAFEDLNKIAKFSKLRIVKNLSVISFSFALLFTGFNSLGQLQSTINQENGVGTISQALTFIMFCISSLLLPKYVIQKIGCKYSILISQLFYIPWIASNFYPHWATLFPSAMLTGMAASTLWSGQCTYFNKASALYCSLLAPDQKEERNIWFGESTKSNVTLEPLSVRNSLSLSEPSTTIEANSYGACKRTSSKSLQDVRRDSDNFCNVDLAVVKGGSLEEDHLPSEKRIDLAATKTTEILKSFKDREAINARFFGCHSLVFRSAEIWGNLLSYFVLSHGGVADVASCSCGAHFCNGQCLSENIAGISDDRRYLLTGISVLCAASAFALVIFGLDQIEASREPVSFSTQMVLATWNHCKKKEQLFLIPITMLLGLAQGFYIADVTKAYIGCALGTYHIGLVTVGYGISSSATSSVSGWIVKHVGRIPVFSTGIITTVGTCILLLTWSPTASQPYVFYLIAVLWGIMVGTMWAQLQAFYGVLFKEDQEAAFASTCVFESIGYTVAFVYSIFLCTYIKIYVLITVACIGLVGYLMTENKFVLKKNEMSHQQKINGLDF